MRNRRRRVGPASLGRLSAALRDARHPGRARADAGCRAAVVAEALCAHFLPVRFPLLGVSADNPGNSLFDLLYDYVSTSDGRLNRDEKYLILHMFLEERNAVEFIELSGWSRSKVTYVIRSARKKIAEILKDNYF